MAERAAVVVAADADGLRVRPVEAACRGCTLGCGGRCDLFRADLAGEVLLPMPGDARFDPGDRVVLSLDEATLRRAAIAGYGRALLGLFVGATAGFGLAELLAVPRDPATLIGLAAGTYLGMRGSKRADPAPHIRLDSPAAAPTSQRGLTP